MVILGPILYLLFSYGVAMWGQDRKFGFWGYFFGSLLLTPLIGALLVMASDSPALEEEKPGN